VSAPSPLVDPVAMSTPEAPRGAADAAKLQPALDEVIKCFDLKGLANRLETKRERCLRNKVRRYVAISEGREPPPEEPDEEEVVANFEGAKKKALESARATNDWSDLLRDFRGYDVKPEKLAQSCVTAQLGALDPELNVVVGGLEREYQAWRKKVDTFLAVEKGLHYRIDYEFEQRNAPKKKVKKGETAAATNLYTRTTTAGKPEMMKRLEAKGGVPEKFYCVVKDARWIAGKKTTPVELPNQPVAVECETPGDVSTRIMLLVQSSESLQRGDLVSLPLANAKVPPMKLAEGKKSKKKKGGDDAGPSLGTPVLSLTQTGGGRRFRYVTERVWVVSGAKPTIEEKRANCPAQDQLLAEKARLETQGFLKGGSKKGGSKKAAHRGGHRGGGRHRR